MVRSKSKHTGYLCVWGADPFKCNLFFNFADGTRARMSSVSHGIGEIIERIWQWIARAREIDKKNSDRNNRDVQLGFCHQRNHSGFHPNTFVQAKIEFLICWLKWQEEKYWKNNQKKFSPQLREWVEISTELNFMSVFTGFLWKNGQKFWKKCNDDDFFHVQPGLCNLHQRVDNIFKFNGHVLLKKTYRFLWYFGGIYHKTIFSHYCFLGWISFFCRV